VAADGEPVRSVDDLHRLLGRWPLAGALTLRILRDGALATIEAPYCAEGTPLDFEITVEAVRHRVPAVVVRTPFFNPPRKVKPVMADG